MTAPTVKIVKIVIARLNRRDNIMHLNYPGGLYGVNQHSSSTTTYRAGVDLMDSADFCQVTNIIRFHVRGNLEAGVIDLGR